MNSYVVALAVGILVGVIYAALQVKSPAPPVVALIGLLGILIGESGYPYLKNKFNSSSAVALNAAAKDMASKEKTP
ncbi:MAG: DUF1427 family protein [Proteobacteria bacterium]|nr:MAG: DUF1427 family protein [Pseudomonadota bacterium]